MPKDTTTDTKSTSGNTFTFSKPVMFDGNTIESIELNLPAIKGRDIARCNQHARQAMTAQGEIPVAIEAEHSFLIMVAAVASKQPIELFNEISGPDYMRLLTTVRGFLFSGQ